MDDATIEDNGYAIYRRHDDGTRGVRLAQNMTAMHVMAFLQTGTGGSPRALETVMVVQQYDDREYAAQKFLQPGVLLPGVDDVIEIWTDSNMAGQMAVRQQWPKLAAALDALAKVKDPEANLDDNRPPLLYLVGFELDEIKAVDKLLVEVVETPVRKKVLSKANDHANFLRGWRKIREVIRDAKA